MNDTGEEKKTTDTTETSGTPYDDVFHTLLNDCSRLIIPIINEIFHENYQENETITPHANEHYINGQDTELNKRVTDNCFDIQGKTYHTECQSTSDSSMLVRMFEYGTQIALDNGNIAENILEVEFPHAAVLFLRSTRNTPDSMKIHMKTPGGDVSYDIPVMKMQSYTLEQIFEKNLLFLIPFYIFNHEKKLKEYNTNPEKLEALKNEYEYIKNRLDQLCTEYKIDAYTRFTITRMLKLVVENLAAKYENVKEGVGKIMGGKVLDYEEKRILNQGIKQGIEQGREQGIEQGREQGIEQGIEQGREESMRELIESMIEENVEISFILKVSKVSEEKVRDIKEKMIKEGKLKEEGKRQE